MSQRKARPPKERIVTDRIEQRRLLIEALARTGAEVLHKQVHGHDIAIVIPGLEDPRIRTVTVGEQQDIWRAVEEALERALSRVREVKAKCEPLERAGLP